MASGHILWLLSGFVAWLFTRRTEGLLCGIIARFTAGIMIRLFRWLRGRYDSGFLSGLHGRKPGWLSRRFYIRPAGWLGCWKPCRLLRRFLFGRL